MNCECLLEIQITHVLIYICLPAFMLDRHGVMAAPIAHTCVPAWGHGSHMRPSLMNWKMGIL